MVILGLPIPHHTPLSHAVLHRPAPRSALFPFPQADTPIPTKRS